MEKAIQIAWDYLEQTGQINDPELTSWLLLDTVEHMARCGERRRVALSNGAITTYERLRADSLATLSSKEPFRRVSYLLVRRTHFGVNQGP